MLQSAGRRSILDEFSPSLLHKWINQDENTLLIVLIALYFSHEQYSERLKSTIKYYSTDIYYGEYMKLGLYKTFSLLSSFSSIACAILWFFFSYYFIMGTFKLGGVILIASLENVYEGVAMLNEAFMFLIPIIVCFLILDISFILIAWNSRGHKKPALLASLLSLTGTIILIVGWFGYMLNVNNYLDTVRAIFNAYANDVTALKHQYILVTSKFSAKSINYIRIAFFVKGIAYFLFPLIIISPTQGRGGIAMFLAGLGMLLTAISLIIGIFLPVIGFLWLGAVLYKYFIAIIKIRERKVKK